MWLHPDPDQALRLAVRFCVVAQVVGLLELTFVRGELASGGFLDWSLIGILSPRTRTAAGSFIRRAFRRLSSRGFLGLVVVDSMVACALWVWPASLGLIAVAVAMQVMLIKRHHITIDGSDQMMLVVLLTCLLGRLGGDAAATRAAVTFLAAELTLAYLVAGVSKGTSKYWQSGEAFAMIVQTRMYGQPAAARVVDRHPAVGHAASYAVICWESFFLLTLTAPLAVVVVVLALGAGFHAGCAVVMGLNRFTWAFVASYPAVVCTNLAVRGGLGGHAADTITIGVAAAGLLALAWGRHRALVRAGGAALGSPAHQT
jgi:hypothetical protein